MYLQKRNINNSKFINAQLVKINNDTRECAKLEKDTRAGLKIISDQNSR